DEGKRCAETLFFDYHRQHKVKIRVVRIFNTYGPRMHPNDGRVVSNFIVQALKNEPITLYGDGSQTRAFCYVDDLIEGFLRMMDAADDQTGPMNLGNPVETSVAELARLIIELTGSRSEITHRPLPIDDPIQRCPDISQAKAVLDWHPRLPIEHRLGLRNVGAALDRVVDRQGPVRDLGARAGQFDDQPGELGDRRLDRVAEVHRPGLIVRRVHHPQEAFDQIVDIAEGAGLAAVA